MESNQTKNQLQVTLELNPTYNPDIPTIVNTPVNSDEESSETEDSHDFPSLITNKRIKKIKTFERLDKMNIA
jgi:hypothetical protein